MRTYLCKKPKGIALEPMLKFKQYLSRQNVMGAINKEKTAKVQQYYTNLMNNYREWHKSTNIPKHISEKIRTSFGISHNKYQQTISNLKKMSIEKRSSVLYRKLKGMTDFLGKNQSELSRHATMIQGLNTLQKENVRPNDELKVFKEKHEIAIFDLTNHLNTTERRYQDALECESLTEFDSKFESEKQKIFDREELPTLHEIELKESRERIQELEEEQRNTLSTLKDLQRESLLKQTQIDNLTHETKSAKKESSRLQSTLDGVRNLLSKYEFELEESRRRIQDLEEERRNNLSTLKELRYEDSLSKTQIDTLTHKIKATQQESSRLQSTLDGVRNLLSKHEAELEESRKRIQDLEEARRNALSTLKELRYEDSLNKTQIDTLSHEIKYTKQEASCLQSALDGIRGICIHKIELHEPREIKSAKNEASQLQLMLGELESEKQKMIDYYKIELQIHNLQSFNAIANLPSDILSSNINSATPIRDNRLIYFMNTLSSNRSGNIIAPTKIRQQLFVSLRSRGYNKTDHPTIDLFTEFNK
ncbi:1745_t:CDS:2 [Ambispora leptoticha]|uniref:1745_t:CDS:1 n=1 Tax=Ambispora leptoticha TaxID=144679 RepID=A0A9N9G3Z4_9GLOM|nr:1745_t:CDS:2 [Ambispora leptoticha]